MFCSVIIPTIGRPSLDRAVQSVLDQPLRPDAFEVIVVNDSGRPLPPANWQQDDRVSIIASNRRKLSVARNTGTAVAQGDYLLYLDDDDWLLPNALMTFWRLAETHPHAVCLYGGADLINAKGVLLGQVNLGRTGNCAIQLMGGSWLPCGSWIVQADALFSVGLFPPLLRSGEETHVQRLLALQGDFAYTDESVVSILRGVGWQTTVPYESGARFNRISRDLCLNKPGVFSRLRASADSRYWNGRILHTYLTAARWNIEKKQYLTGLSRLLYATLSLLLAGKHLLTTHFWRAVKDSKVPCTEDRIRSAWSK